MPITDRLRDRQFMMKVVYLAFLSSLVFIAIGAYFIIMELMG